MSKRIFLLPGFGENHTCYRELIPRLRGEFELIHVDYRFILKHLEVQDVSAIAVGRQIINEYDILPDDRIIGHSMGGYFGYAISAIQQNPLAMLASFSDTDKIVRMTKNRVVNYFVAGTGLLKTPLMKLYLSKRVNNKRVLNEMLSIQDNFKTFSNADMVKMLRLSFGDDKVPRPDTPPLRIHSKDDTTIRPPDEEYCEVEGGHFNLLFYPDQVHHQLKNWLT